MKVLSSKHSIFKLTAAVAFFVATALWYSGPGTPVASGAVEAGSGKAVVITDPADGAVIHGSSVDVIFELRNKGARGDHVHLYLDGRLVKPLHGRKVAYTINGLRRGHHSITIRLATKGHRLLEPQDSVTVEVR